MGGTNNRAVSSVQTLTQKPESDLTTQHAAAGQACQGLRDSASDLGHDNTGTLDFFTVTPVCRTVIANLLGVCCY